MKKFFLAATLALTPVLTTGCQSLGIDRPGEQVVLTGTKALIAAEYAYNGIGTVVLSLLRSDDIKGDDARKVREANAKATNLLVQAKNAKDEVSKADIGRQLLDVVTTLNSFKKDN